MFRDVSGGFTNLVVNGQAVGGDAPPNTSIPLPGIGTVWVHRVQRTAEGLRVTMLEVKVGSSNGLGLPAGSDLRIVSANIAIY